MTGFSTVANAPRRVVPLGVHVLAGFRIKVYSFAYQEAGARQELVEAALAWAEARLTAGPTRRAHHGVGFLGVNDGNGMCQVFLDLWAEQNELHHYIQVSPKDDPSSLADPPGDYNSVCVWDLAVQCHERAAWVGHVLRNPNGPDLDNYLHDLLDGEV